MFCKNPRFWGLDMWQPLGFLPVPHCPPWPLLARNGSKSNQPSLGCAGTHATRHIFSGSKNWIHPWDDWMTKIYSKWLVESSKTPPCRPLPMPAGIYCTQANFASHLQVGLRMQDVKSSTSYYIRLVRFEAHLNKLTLLLAHQKVEKSGGSSSVEGQKMADLHNFQQAVDLMAPRGLLFEQTLLVHLER